MKAVLIGYQYDRDLQLLMYDPKENRIIVVDKDRDHRSYLYTRDKRIPEAKFIVEEKFVNLHTGVRQKDMPYKKISVVNPGNISMLRSRLNNSWENRIFYNLRYAYDKMLIYGCLHNVDFEGLQRIKLPFNYNDDLEEFFGKAYEQDFIWMKRCSLDIEVYNEKKQIPNVDRATDTVTTISIVGNDGKKWILMLDSSLDEIKKIEKDVEFDLPSGDTVVANLEYYSKESDLLIRTFEVTDKYPIIVTHYGDGFDLPYLWKRCKNLKVKNPIIKKRVGATRYFGLKNKIHIDTTKLFQNSIVRKEIFHNSYNNAKLKELSVKLLGKEKMDMPSYENYDPLATGIYCLNDSILTLEFTTFDDDKVFKMIMMMSRVANADLEFINRKRISNWIRSYYHFFHRILNYIVPNEEDFLRFNAIKLDYSGAIVLDPEELETVGGHFDLWGVDFASLYPSNIDNDNISYDTVLCDHEECRSNLVPGYDNLWICTKNRGILAIIWGTIKNLRIDRYKKIHQEYSDRYDDKRFKDFDWDLAEINYGESRKSSREGLRLTRDFWKIIVDILRIYINAGYGVFADDNLGDLYCLPIPCAITAYGREKLLLAKEIAENFGAIILLGHTDSLYLKGVTKKQIYAIAKMITSRTKVPFEIQGHYKFMTVWKKGNYIVVDDNNEVTIKGMMGKKKHIFPYVKNGFRNITDIVKLIDNEDSLKSRLEQISSLVIRLKEKIDRGEIEYEEVCAEITLHKKISEGKGQDYNVARLYRDKIDRDIAPGDTIRKIPTIKDICGETALPVEFFFQKEDRNGKPLLHDWSHVNKDKIIENMAGVFKQVLEPLGVDIDKLYGLDKKKKKGRGRKRIPPSHPLEYFFGTPVAETELDKKKSKEEKKEEVKVHMVPEGYKGRKGTDE